MKTKVKLGERGQVVIPKRIREQLALGKNHAMEVTLVDDVVTLRPVKDMAAVRKHLAFYQGRFADQLREEGYSSPQTYMDELRDRDDEYKRVLGVPQ